MIRNLGRIVTRHFPVAFSRRSEDYVRVNPIYIAGAFVSSSCVQCRRYKYGTPVNEFGAKAGAIPIEEVDNEEGESDSSIPFNRNFQQKTDKGNENDEYISEESDNDECESTLYQNLNVNFVTLPRGDSARREVENCISETTMDKKMLVKTTRSVKALMHQGLKPEKIFFVILNDLLYLESSLNGIELYKIHPTNAPLEMQRKKRAPFFAIFQRNDVNENPSVASQLPLTIICDRLYKYDLPKKIIAAALTCGCQKIFFTSECQVLPKSLDFRLAEAKNDVLVNLDQSWDQIENNVPDDAKVLVLMTENNDQKRNVAENNRIPAVNLNDLEAWTTEDEIILICTGCMSSEIVNFCLERNGREIVIPGAVDTFYKSLMSLGVITMELKKQWETREKSKKVSRQLLED